ncbi:DUF411 domain-containing protein [Aurantimonas sp. A2-1-M11]|uniref:DUF411 domain-containing protein n=1 Tax=Aurantimonas sp. A2-1-M11 TaxID=3113712 RepID=UPI002F930AE8
MTKPLVSIAVSAVLLMLGTMAARADHADRHMSVWKSPTCGCCEAWTDIAREHGFDVTVTNTDEMSPIKRAAGVPAAMEGCHTATIDGYVIEGHVPMDAIDRLLAERPALAGLSAPGMPMGSPGMGDDPDARYDVYGFGGDTAPAVYQQVGPR